MTDSHVTVYYDGACPLCSREIDHYRKRDRDGRLHLVDIAAPGFDAASLGLDPRAVQKVLHVRLSDGSLVTGVDAFIAIWRVLPGLGGLAQLADRPVVHPLLQVGYAAFALLRPYLPKRRRDDGCRDGRCAV